MGWTRREFLKAAAASAAGAVAFSGCSLATPQHEFQLESPALLAEDLVTGMEDWYASVCGQCAANCGVIVRVASGKAIKIEGNPAYPVNQGKLSARGQAALQALYNPDRIAGPKRRTGDRGSGQFQEVTWDDALKELTDRLTQLSNNQQSNSLLFITRALQGTRALVADRFVRAYGGQRLAFEALDRIVDRTAIQRAFGQPQLPDFDLTQVQYLVSFGADFLGTWLSPVRYGRAFGVFRQGVVGQANKRQRGYFVDVEPRLSMTAASADEWVPVNPGTEGLLALSMAQVMIAEGLADRTAASAMLAAGATLDAFTPDKVADQIGVSADRIRGLAHDFASRGPSLAIGGDAAGAQTNGLFNLMAVYALNYLGGTVGTGAIRPNPPSPLSGVNAAEMAAPFSTWQQLATHLRSDNPVPVNLLMVDDANPVYGLPQSLGLADGLRRIPYIVSFSSFMDETTVMADLILPDHVYLEDSGLGIPDPGPGFSTVGVQQAVVQPVGNTWAMQDVLLTIASRLGGATQLALPWNSTDQLMREIAQPLQKLGGSVSAQTFDDFWTGVRQRGGWWDTKTTGTAKLTPPTLPAAPVAPSFAGDEKDYPYHLHLFPSVPLLDGRFANLPWLQGLPDPTTTVVWQTWIEINPQTAQKLGVGEGDIVSVESPQGKAEVPVYVYPGLPPSVVAMPMGQGHKNYGRYAEKRGFNPFDLVAPLTEQETGGLAWAATRVKVQKTGRALAMPKFEGTVKPLAGPDSEVVQVTSG